jgi:hypothetical protein
MFGFVESLVGGLDEVAVSPVLLGAGLPLFDGIDQDRISLNIAKAVIHA